MDFDDEQDSEDELLDTIIQLEEDADRDYAALQSFLGPSTESRLPRYKYNRRDWFEDLFKLRHTNEFQSRYHMTEASFNALVELLRPSLTLDEKQSRRSSSGNSPIIPEVIVGAGLRFLGGELVKSIADIFGISLSSTYRIIDAFLTAVDDSEELAIRMPETADQLKKCADDWNKLSGAFGLYYGCIGAIDGWLACTEKPKNVTPIDYFSGHYQRHGINVQAMCDSNLRFIYLAITLPGRSHDQKAFRRCEELQRWLQSLPATYFIIGDNAYPLTKNILIPFSGAQKQMPYNRTYNYYLSQLRIRIEMAFGRLTTKWRIFRRNLTYGMEKNSLIIRAAGRLHNFVIEKDNLNFESASIDDVEDFGVIPMASGPTYNRGYVPLLPRRGGKDDSDDEEEEIDRGYRRQRILDAIQELNMKRPEHNLIRNQELDANSVYEEIEDDE